MTKISFILVQRVAALCKAEIVQYVANRKVYISESRRICRWELDKDLHPGSVD